MGGEKHYRGEMHNMTFDLETKLAKKQATSDEVMSHLVGHYYAGIYQFALNLLRDGDEADDVVQKTILIAAKKIDQYKPHSNMKAWVYKIAFNEGRKQLRRRQTRQRLQGVLTKLWKNNTAPSAEAEMIAHEGQQHLWQTVEKLKEKHRHPVILRYLHNMSPPDIAEVLGVPVGTVHSRLHYAHKQLHGLLTAEGLTK